MRTDAHPRRHAAQPALKTDQHAASDRFMACGAMFLVLASLFSI